jgi:hypothetical protein
MNANLKRAAAIGSLVALVFASGCASLDATVAYDDEGNNMPSALQANILQQMDKDSQAGGD